jgi:hypothetical protein
MSDVPELDKLIEEHAVFKFNTAWDRRERRFLAALRITLTAAMVALLCGLVGWLGLLTLPIIWSRLNRIIPNPPYRDPFKRYRYM